MALALLTGLVSLVFASILLDQNRRRARPYLVLWTFGLAWYALGSLTEFWGALAGWSPALYRLWYLSGAVGVAAFLGMGVVYLHTPGKFGYVVALAVAFGTLPAIIAGDRTLSVVGLTIAMVLAIVQIRRPESLAFIAMVILLGGTAIAAIVLFQAPIDVGKLPSGEATVTGSAATASVRLLTPLFNIPGAAALIGGAIRSAWRSRRRMGQSRRAIANAFIMIGAFVDSGASGLARLGWPGAFYAGQLVGLLCIFAGFLITSESSQRYVPPLVEKLVKRRHHHVRSHPDL